MEFGDCCLILAADPTQRGEFPLLGGVAILLLFSVGFWDSLQTPVR